MADTSSECLADTCGLCLTETCTHDCHDGMEYRFPYGWQVRESYSRGPVPVSRELLEDLPPDLTTIAGIRRTLEEHDRSRAAAMGEYRLVIPAPCPWLNANDRLHRMRKAQRVAAWRHAAYAFARAARLPKGLQRVRIDAVARFTIQRHRDRSNYHATLKPVIDGLAAGRGTAVGYGLIPDDSDRYLDGPHVTIGPPVKPKYGFGVLELLITDLSGEAS